MQSFPLDSQINPAEYKAFLEFKAFKQMQGANLSQVDLTLPVISAYPLKNDQEGGLTMRGAIRGKGHCPQCGEKFVDSGKTILCSKCKTSPKKYYVDLSYDGQRIRIFKDKEGYTLDSYQRAHRLLEHIRYEIDNHTFDLKFWVKTDFKKYIFDGYTWSWFERSKVDLAPSTKRKRMGFIKNYHIPFFGQKDIRKIRSGQIEDYYLWLPQSLSNKQKKNIIDDLRKLFNDAWRREDIEKIPVFPRIDFETPMFKWIDRQTQEKILEQINSYDRDIFRFIMLTGCRPGEARALMWDCIDFTQKIIYLKRTFSDATLKEQTKTGTWRPLPIVDEIEEILKRQGRAINGYVFVNQCGRHYSGMMREIWNDACKKVGVDINLYNGTRHSFGSQKLNEGFSLEEIGAVMGHTDVKMTKRYAKILTENLKTVIEGKKIVTLKTVTKSSPGAGNDCKHKAE